MKSTQEIENLSLEQLEAISMDRDIEVPEGFKQHIADTIVVRQKVSVFMEEKDKGRSPVMAAGIAASIVLMIGIGFGIADYIDRPEDTFDDPYLAYAEMQKAFGRISDGLQKGLAMAEDSQQTLDKAVSVFSE